jgi:lysophospholipase L1-like esterase
MRLHRGLGALIFALLFAASLAAQSGFYLKDGDRVVFYGDSITDQRLYTTFTETFVLTRFPRMQVEFVHSGWGGDRVTGGGGGPIEVRLNRDVTTFRPTVITIMLGMNDGRYRAFDEQIFNAYSTGYTKMVQTLRTNLPAARMTLIQPSPYDDVTRTPLFDGGYNAVLVRYGQFVKQLAQQNGLDVADLNSSVVAALQTANTADSANAQKIVPDRVHPGPAGHLLMAGALLKAWNAPGTVSAVDIDAASGKVARSDNTVVSGLSAGSSLSWTQADRSLPMPVDTKDPITSLAVGSSDFVQTLNQQTLKVTGLKASTYSVAIDGEEIGVFTKEALAEGVNLATLSTPMARQAASVHSLTLKHNSVHFTRWRQVQLPLENDDLIQKPVVLGALDSLESELIREQRTKAQPVPHRFELTAK